MSSQGRGKELINGRLRRTPLPFRNVLKALNLNIPDEIVTTDYQVQHFFFILYYAQQMRNYFTNYHTPTCFDTIV